MDGGGDVRRRTLGSHTMPPSRLEILASESHAKLRAIRNVFAFSLRAWRAPGAHAAPDQRTAEPSREPGCSGA